MENGLASHRRRQIRRYAIYGTAAVVVGAVAYKAYSSDAFAQTRQSLGRLRTALQKYSEALSSGAELCSTIVTDLQSFMQSDSGEVPGSVRQLAKLLQSREVTQTTAKTVSAVCKGIAGDSSRASNSPGAVDKVLDALLSDRGHSLVSVAVSMGARNLVGAIMEANVQQAQQQQRRPGALPQQGLVERILDFLATDSGRQFAVAAITTFVTNGMRVYMDATLDVNFYEDIFSSMARPAHLEAVKQCIGMFAREAVGTAIQGSPQPRPERQRSGRPRLIQELHSPPSPCSPTRHHQQQQCAAFPGSPMDSAYCDRSPSSAPSSTAHLPRGDPFSDESASDAGAAAPGAARRCRPAGVHAASMPNLARWEAVGAARQAAGAAPAAAAAAEEDLDSDSLLHARGGGGARKPAEQAQQDANLTWLPAVTREVLAVVKDPNARSVLVGAAGATARELGVAAVAGLGQLEVTRRWGTRSLVALVLLSFLMLCLLQELMRTAMMAVLR